MHKIYIFLCNIVIVSFSKSRCNSTNSFQKRVDCFPLPFTNKPDSVQQLTDFFRERGRKNIIIFVVYNVVVKKMGWWYLYLSATKPIHLFIPPATDIQHNQVNIFPILPSPISPKNNTSVVTNHTPFFSPDW